MDYVIISNPVDNDNRGYKDTGILGFYRWQDVQCLAELFGQANSCVACDARYDACGNWNQNLNATTLWPFFGQWMLGQFIPGTDYLHPEEGHTWYDRMERLANGRQVLGLPIPYTANNFNTAWCVMDRDPFNGLTRNRVVEEPALVNAGTQAGTRTLFGDMCYLKNTALEPWLQMNRPTMTMNAWTSGQQIIQLYQDAKKWSNYQIYVMTWSDQFAEGGAQGQPFDITFPGANIQTVRTTKTKDWQGTETENEATIHQGWSNDCWNWQFHWKKSAVVRYIDYSNKLNYEWSSYEDNNEMTLPADGWARHVPVPTVDFGMRCLFERSVMTVWKATFRDVVYMDTGLDHDTTTTKWWYLISDGRKDDRVLTFVDALGNDRGLCARYTFGGLFGPYWAHTEIPVKMEWEIPEFEQQWVPLPQTYVQSQEQWLDIQFMGAYSLERSRLTEQIVNI